jgi:hypothetical protein
MRARYGWLVMAAGIGACSDGVSDPNPIDPLTLDVAMVAADAAIEDIRAMDAFMGVPGATRSFDRTVSVTFFDADGNEQNAFDGITTATIIRSSEVNRAVEREGWSATIRRTREQTITGLEGEEEQRTVNGSGTEAVSRSRHTDEDGVRTYEMSGTVVWDVVVHGVPREDNPYPLSGTVTRSVTIVITNGPNGDETRERTSVITFNGTQFATLTVDGETMEVDLSARDGRTPFRRRGR